MRVVVIAGILLFIQLAIGLTNAIGISEFGFVVEGTGVGIQKEWTQDIKSVETDQYLRSDVTSDVSTSFGFGDFIVGLRIFIRFIARVLDVKHTLEIFGLDSSLAFIIQFPIFFIYGLGLFQVISNRATKGMS